ncbi:MAG: phage adaptor protein [Caldimonas sp.]
MGTIQASTIVTKAALLLFDVANVKWSQAELLMWLSDAQRATVALLPEASSQLSVVRLSAGARQVLPNGSLMLLEVTRNMGTNGATPGRILKRVDRAVLDETQPNWAGAAPVPSPLVYTYNKRDKGAFYVSPPADGTGYVEINVSMEPTEITAGATAIGVDDIYAPALLDYVMWRAKSKQVPFAGDPKDAQAYLASWATYITGDAEAAARLAAQMGALATMPLQQQGSQPGGQG